MHCCDSGDNRARYSNLSGYDASQTRNNGSIDEVSIFNVAMSANEITTAYDRVARHGAAHRCSDY